MGYCLVSCSLIHLRGIITVTHTGPVRLQDRTAELIRGVQPLILKPDLRQHLNSNTAGEVRYDVTADVPAGARASDRQVKQETTQN